MHDHPDSLEVAKELEREWDILMRRPMPSATSIIIREQDISRFARTHMRKLIASLSELEKAREVCEAAAEHVRHCHYDMGRYWPGWDDKYAATESTPGLPERLRAALDSWRKRSI
jgi:hypothetical protein